MFKQFAKSVYATRQGLVKQFLMVVAIHEKQKLASDPG
jgi:hypothetical protein